MKKNKNAYIQWATACSPNQASPAAPPSSLTSNCSPSTNDLRKNNSYRTSCVARKRQSRLIIP